MHRSGRLHTKAGRALLLEALSDRMLRQGEKDIWHWLFLGPSFASIRFDAARLTLLATDAPLTSLTHRAASNLAARLGGNCEAFDRTQLLFSFIEPEAALRALSVLRQTADWGIARSALFTISTTIATYPTPDGGTRKIVGPEVERAGHALLATEAGTVTLCPRTYDLIGNAVGLHVPDCVVTTESEGHQALLTFAPLGTTRKSGLAGLGPN